MKITVEGYSPIILPSGLVSFEKGAFDSDTPYISKLMSRFGRRSYREKLLPTKLACLQSIRARTASLGGYESFFEPLAGVGLSARIFASSGALSLNDRDEACQAILRQNFTAAVTGYDIHGMEFPPHDTIFLDFNDFTLKRLAADYGSVLKKGLGAANRFLVLNDCSVFYFRYGPKSFAVYSELLGQPISSVEGYFRALRIFLHKRFSEWYVVHAAYFRDSSFLLFAREDAPLQLVRPLKLPKVELVSPLFGELE